VEALPHKTDAAVTAEDVGKCGVPPFLRFSLALSSPPCLSSP